MSRRDTIIIAVLINTGMLAILFMMAIHSEDEPMLNLRDVPSTMVEETSHSKIEITDHFEPIALAQTSSSDEIDNVLKDFQAPVKFTPIAVASSAQPPKYKTSVIQEKPIVKMPTPTNTPKAHDPQYVEVTIKRGDCLGKIALANNTTVREIKDCNQMSSERIDIGQVLRVPVNTKKSILIKEREQPDTLVADGTEFYTMRRGDNPWKIAKQFHVDFDEFLRLNNLDEEKARNLKIGDRLRVK